MRTMSDCRKYATPEPNRATTFFMKAIERVELEGFYNEIDYRRNSTFEKCTPEKFFEEYIYCILNLGMREQKMRPIYDQFMRTMDLEDIKTRFPNKQKVAAKEAIDNFVRWHGELKCAKDPVEYLAGLPLIGKTTKWHLAQNIGIDCVKPDRHLKRLAARFGFVTPLEMCKCIQREIGYGESLKVIDLALWRYCNLYGSEP